MFEVGKVGMPPLKRSVLSVALRNCLKTLKSKLATAARDYATLERGHAHLPNL